jgi:O-antigen ligase
MIFTLPVEGILVVPGLGRVSQAVGLFVVALWGLTVVTTGRIRPPHLFHVAFLLFVIWNAATVLWSVDVELSLTRLLTWVQLMGLAFVLWDVYTTRTAVRYGLQAYVLGAGVSIVSSVQNYLLGIDQGYQRYAATGSHSDGYAIILVLGIPMACYLAGWKGRSRTDRALKLFNYAYVPAALLGIALAGTRTALIALVPGLLFGLWSLTRLQTRARILVVLALAAGAFVLQPLTPMRSVERLGTTGEELTEGDLNGRLILWREGFVAFSSRPFVGVGTGAFASAIPAGKVAHNSFLSVLVETGVVGLIAFGSLLWIVARQALDQSQWDARFWVSALLALAIGASALTFEHKKHTWLLLTLAVASASVRPVDDLDAGPHPVQPTPA